ncbi:hypothetical protein [Streptomyces radicis]|nr:hypothetical protein [Streptomyces radicis]
MGTLIEGGLCVVTPAAAWSPELQSRRPRARRPALVPMDSPGT